MNLLTAAQAATTLNVTPDQVRKLIRSGRLPAFKLGRDWIIDANALEAFANKPRKVGYPKGRPRG